MRESRADRARRQNVIQARHAHHLRAHDPHERGSEPKADRDHGVAKASAKRRRERER
jgi:hypothetical protein